MAEQKAPEHKLTTPFVINIIARYPDCSVWEQHLEKECMQIVHKMHRKKRDQRWIEVRNGKRAQRKIVNELKREINRKSWEVQGTDHVLLTLLARVKQHYILLEDGAFIPFYTLIALFDETKFKKMPIIILHEGECKIDTFSRRIAPPGERGDIFQEKYNYMMLGGEYSISKKKHKDYYGGSMILAGWYNIRRLKEGQELLLLADQVIERVKKSSDDIQKVKAYVVWNVKRDYVLKYD